MPEKMPERIEAGYVSRAGGELETRDWEPADDNIHKYIDSDIFLKSRPELEHAGEMRDELKIILNKTELKAQKSHASLCRSTIITLPQLLRIDKLLATIKAEEEGKNE